jgi:ribosome modulation factor
VIEAANILEGFDLLGQGGMQCHEVIVA